MDPCLFTDIREKSFSLSFFSMILAVGVLKICFVMLKMVPSIPSLQRVLNHC